MNNYRALGYFYFPINNGHFYVYKFGIGVMICYRFHLL